MNRINPYLIAFAVTLGKTLYFSMGAAEAAVLIALLVKLSFDAHLATTAMNKKTKEELDPITTQLKILSDKVIRHENSLNLMNLRK